MKNIILLLSALSFQSFSMEKQVFDYWSLLCGEQNNCSVSQLIAKDPQAKQVIMGVNVNFSVSDTFPVLVLRMPAGLYMSSGVGIKIDDNKPIQVKISQCTNEYCESVIKIDKQLFDELMNGEKANVAFAIKKHKQLTLPVSLLGFKDAYKALLNSRG